MAYHDLVEACRAAVHDEPSLFSSAETAPIRTDVDHAEQRRPLPDKAVTEYEE